MSSLQCRLTSLTNCRAQLKSVLRKYRSRGFFLSVDTFLQIKNGSNYQLCVMNSTYLFEYCLRNTFNKLYCVFCIFMTFLMLLQVNEQRSILHEIRIRKANWIGHILRKNCLLKQAIEGKIKGEIEVTRRQGRKRKRLLDDLKDRRGYSHLKEEALDRSV